MNVICFKNQQNKPNSYNEHISSVCKMTWCPVKSTLRDTSQSCTHPVNPPSPSSPLFGILRRCAQKPERTLSAVDTEWMPGSANTEKGLWHEAARLLPKRNCSVRPAVRDESRRSTTGLPKVVPPLQRRREERRGKIRPPAVRASDEEKRRAEGIG